MTIRPVSDILNPDTSTLSPDARVHQVLDRFREDIRQPVIVVNRQQPVSIFTENDVARLLKHCLADKNARLSDVIPRPLLTTRFDTDFIKAYQTVAIHGYRQLIVVDRNGALAGTVSEKEFLEHIGTDLISRYQDAGSAMIEGISTLVGSSTLEDALDLMADNRQPSLVVASSGVPVAVFSQRDLIRLPGSVLQSPDQLLTELTDNSIITVHPDTQLTQALTLLNTRDTQRLVVVDDNNRICGLVCRRGIIKQLYDRHLSHLQDSFWVTEKELESARSKLQAEHQLKSAEARLAETQRVAQTGTWELLFDNNRLWWSDEIFNILEIEPGTRKPQLEQLLELVHPDDRLRVGRAYLKAVELGSGLDLVFKLMFSENRNKYVHLQCQPAQDSSGQISSLVGTLQDISQLYSFNENLKRTSAEFSRAQAAAKIGNWTYLVEKSRLELSQQTYLSLGREPNGEKLDIESVRGWAHSDDRWIQDDFLEKLLSPKPYHRDQHQPVRIRYCRPDGETRWMELTAEREIGKNRKIVALYGTAQDVTERVFAEQQLEISEERYRLAQRIAGTSVWEWDANIGKMYLASEIYDLLQIRPGSFDGSLEAYARFVHPDDRSRWLEAISNTLNSGKEYNIEYRFALPNSSVRWVHSVGRLFFADDGTIQRMLGILSDITEKKETQVSLHASRSRYRELFDTIGEGVSIFSAVDDGNNFVLTDINRANEAILGRQRKDLLGKDITELMPAAEYTFLLPKMQGVWQTGESCTMQSLSHTSDKSPCWLENRILKMPSGELVKISKDVTDQTKSKIEHERLQRELSQAHKMEALGKLTGGIAHDFNNILALVLGAAELAGSLPETRQDNTRLQQYLDTITDAAGRARDLVGQMMAFSQNRQTPAEALDLRPQVEEFLKLSRATLPSSIEFIESLHPVPRINLSTVELQQLLINLLINARDAMKNKGLLEISLHRTQLENIECSTCHRVISGDWVELSIQDDGPGIDEHLLPHLFEPFFTTKDIGKGTGMGLAVVLGIMKRAGGHVVLDQNKDCGAKFRLLFPPVGSSFNNTDIRSSEPAADIEPPLKGKTLLVDDEADLCVLLSEFLESLGLDVDYYTSSAAALADYQKNPARYDLILTDQTMPQITGKELIEKVRAINATVPIVIMTGFSNALTADTVLELGIDRYLEKPVAFPKLKRVLTELLR